MSRDYYDQLIDQLLRETLGGDRPRDMTTRVMALAKSHDRTRRGWWISVGAAIAASIAIAVSLWLLWPQHYPAPVATNLFVLNSGDVGAGSKLASTEDSSGSLTLGGYVNMDVAPNTSFTLGGGPRFQEKVFLEGGHLDVTTKKKGTFELVVDSATVQVSNTKLGVDVSEVLDDQQQRFVKRMVVKVLEGAAEVRGVDSPETLHAGDSKVFLISNTVLPRLVSSPQSPATPSTTTPNRGGRGVGLRRIPPNGEEPGTAQIQVIVGPGPYSLYGILRHIGPYYFFLQTSHGNFLLGTEETLPPGHPKPSPTSYVHVVFATGRATRIDSVPSLPPGAQVPSVPIPTAPTKLEM